MPTFDEVCAVVDGELEHHASAAPARGRRDVGCYMTLMRHQLSVADEAWAFEFGYPPLPSSAGIATISVPTLRQVRQLAATAVACLRAYGCRAVAPRGPEALPMTPGDVYASLGVELQELVDSRRQPVGAWLSEMHSQLAKAHTAYTLPNLRFLARAAFACLMQHGAPPREAH